MSPGQGGTKALGYKVAWLHISIHAHVQASRLHMCLQPLSFTIRDAWYRLQVVRRESGRVMDDLSLIIK